MTATAAFALEQNSTLNRNKSPAPTSSQVQSPTPKQRETAQYAADMILELRNMAKSARLYPVMVPLEYAYYEAYSIAHQVTVPPGEIERITKLSRTVAELEAREPEA